jgi:hypothetical protein
MVGFGSSLRMARRPGWERAYFDYETLKMLLSQIEAVYEEEGHREAGDLTPLATNHKRGDYRDELFLQNDSDEAYASSSYGIDIEYQNHPHFHSDQDDDSKNDYYHHDTNDHHYHNEYSDTTTNDKDRSRLLESTSEDEEMVAPSECLSWTSRKEQKKVGSAAVAHAKKKKGNQLLLPRREEATDYFLDAHQTFLVESNDVDSDNNNAYNNNNKNTGESVLNTSMQYSSTHEQTFLMGKAQPSTYYSGFNNHGPGTPPQDPWYRTRQGTTPFYTATMQPMSLGTVPSTAPKMPLQLKLHDERRRKRKQRRRRKKQHNRSHQVPPHIRLAHSKARAITERFLGLLRAEVEKVTLFAQSRLGELADTTGSLRFPSHEDSDYGSFSRSGAEHALSDSGMHPSASSSEDERERRVPWSDSSADTETSGPRAVSPSYIHATELFSKGSHHEARDNKKERRIPIKKTVSRPASASVQRQIQNFAELRRRQPIFQRMDHIVGEDLLLLSAVDEADGYTAVGVELMHVLRYISVNVIAIRKICRKHDRLLMNRMLGGYYHLKRKESYQKGHEKKSKTLGGIVLLSLDHDFKGYPAVVNHNKLVGVYDRKIQSLANSTTVQVISSCIALALSEYEVSHSRADALAKLNSQTKTPLRAGVGKSEEKNGKFSCTPGTSAFGLSPSRWRVTKAHFVDNDLEETNKEVRSFPSMDEGDQGPPSSASTVSLTRLRFTVVSIFALKEAARWKKSNFTDFLSRALLVYTGPNVIGEGLDGCSREILDFFVAYSPDAALLLDSDTLYNGLLDGQWRETHIGSVMRTTLAVSINSMADNPFHDGTHLVEAVSIQSIVESIPHMDNVPKNGKAFNDDDTLAETSSLSENMLIINRLSVFLYAANYYIAHSTSNLFVVRTGAHPAHAATVIGAASVGALIGACYQARGLAIQNESVLLTSINLDFFRKCFLFAAFYPVVGNILHALAVSWDSIPLAVFGRMWIGFGSIEILNRQLLNSHHRPIQVVPESANIIISQICGVIFGLLLGAFLALFDLDVSPFGQYVATISSLHTGSYFMAILWAVYWLFVYFQFHRTSSGAAISDETADIRRTDAPPNESVDSDSSNEVGGTSQSMGDYETDTKVARYGQNIQAIFNMKAEVTIPIGDDPSAFDNSQEVKHVSSRDSTINRNLFRQWKSLLGRLRRVVSYTVAIPVTLAGIVFCRLSHELLFTSCALVTNRYFTWNGSHTGLILGLMSGLWFPINYFCGRTTATFDERTVIKNALALTALSFLFMINWAEMVNVVSHIRQLFDEDIHGTYHPYDWGFGVFQYLIGLTISYVGVVSLEGAALSLMSKIYPSRPRYISCGSLVTFVSLLARILANIHVLIVGLSHRLVNTDIVNSVILPLLGVCIAGIYVVRKHFFFLI